MLQHLQHLGSRRGERGASAVEYGLLVAAIAAVIVVIIFALGGVVKKLFSDTCTSFNSAASAGQTCTS